MRADKSPIARGRGACRMSSLVIIAILGVLQAILCSAANADGLLSSAKRSLDPVTAPKSAVAAGTRVSESYGNLPLHFEVNRGQTDPQVKFLARAGRQTLFLTSTEAVLFTTNSETAAHDREGPGVPKRRDPETGTVLRMNFAGATATPLVTGMGELPGKVNYFVGNDPTKWRKNVSTYAKVRYDDLYPGIDLIFYGTWRHIEFDFVVRPGADPNRIVLAINGADRLEVDNEGDLMLHTAARVIRQRKPVIYQELDGVRKEIPGGYLLTGGDHVSFWIAAYDPRQSLVIDPVLSYSTFLGGSGDDTGYGIAVDAVGGAYVTGFTTSSDFPTTAGALQPTFGFDAFVTKLDPTGSALVYSTYLGGSGVDFGIGIAVDTLGNAHVTGGTFSIDFPTTSGAFQSSLGGSEDAFVTKLDPLGSALVYSSYLGGSIADEGVGIAVDALGNAYVTGRTGSEDFPATAGAFQTTFGGFLGDAFVAKLNPLGTALVYSTYLGGSFLDAGSGVAVDALGHAYVTGRTGSSDFPTTAEAFRPILSGVGSDAFVTKLDPLGSALIYSTLIGGSNGDEAFGIALDAAGNAYVTGVTFSTDFPTTASAFQTTPGGSFGDAFVSKLNPLGSALVYSTYLGGSSVDEGFAIAVDSLGNAYVTGLTASANFPTTEGTFRPTLGGGGDAFVTKLNPIGTALVYSTYLGGSLNEVGQGIAVDALGNAYVTGFTSSSDFPTTAGAFQPTFGGTGDAYVAKITAPRPVIVSELFLHGSGGTTNPPTLTLDDDATTSTTAKYKDAGSVNFGGGNSWTEIGTWSALPEQTDGNLVALGDLHVWLGLRNSDDQGTRFDLRAEIYKNAERVTSGLTRCIAGTTRNSNNAQEVTAAFNPFAPANFDGITDVLTLKVLTRIGTNPDDTKCPGHNNATGLRLYFDAVNRASRFGAVAP